MLDGASAAGAACGRELDARPAFRATDATIISASRTTASDQAEGR